MRPNLIYLAAYCLYFLLLALAWLVASPGWQSLVFFLTYVSATVAIATLGYLIDRKEMGRS